MGDAEDFLASLPTTSFGKSDNQPLDSWVVLNTRANAMRAAKARAFVITCLLTRLHMVKTVFCLILGFFWMILWAWIFSIPIVSAVILLAIGWVGLNLLTYAIYKSEIEGFSCLAKGCLLIHFLYIPLLFIIEMLSPMTDPNFAGFFFSALAPSVFWSTFWILKYSSTWTEARRSIWNCGYILSEYWATSMLSKASDNWPSSAWDFGKSWDVTHEQLLPLFRIKNEIVRKDALRDARLLGLCLKAEHLMPIRFVAHAISRWEVWEKGYGLACEVDGTLFVYKKVR